MTLDPAVRDRVAALLRDGTPRNEIARLVGCSAGSVTAIAREQGHAFDRSAIETAVAARGAYDATQRTYDGAARVALINRGLAVADRLLRTLDSPRALQAWAGAVGVLIDKRRLEDGQSTERVEVLTDAVRDRLAGRLSQLAAAGDPDGPPGGVH